MTPILDPTNSARRSRGAEFVSVIVAAVVILLVQFQLVRSPVRLPLALSVPVVWLFMARFAMRAPLAEAAGRAYLLCFIAGLAGLVGMAGEISADLATSLDPASKPSGGPTSVLPLMASKLGSLGIHFIAPILLGVAIYAACSAFESNPAAQGVAKALAQLDAWLSSSDAPEELKKYISEFRQGLTDLHASNVKWVEQTRQSALALDAYNKSLSAVETAFRELTQVARSAKAELNSLTLEVTAAHAGLDQIKASVSEIGSVVDEFAAIASHNILTKL